MKKKIDINLPDTEQLLAGLAPEALHPKLAKARAALADAEKKLGNRRAAVAELEQRISGLPDRILRGEAAEAELVKAIAEREAGTRMVDALERQVAQAREVVAAEERAAMVILKKELDRRAEEVDRAEREFDEVMGHIDTLRANLLGARLRAGVL